MSINKLKNNLVLLIALIFFFSLLTSTIRQLFVNYRTDRQIVQKQKELQELEEKNLALKVRLEEVQSPKFLDEEARRILGVGSTSGSAVGFSTERVKSENVSKPEETEASNFQKWREFFGLQ